MSQSLRQGHQDKAEPHTSVGAPEISKAWNAAVAAASLKVSEAWEVQCLGHAADNIDAVPVAAAAAAAAAAIRRQRGSSAREFEQHAVAASPRAVERMRDRVLQTRSAGMARAH